MVTVCTCLTARILPCAQQALPVRLRLLQKVAGYPKPGSLSACDRGSHLEHLIRIDCLLVHTAIKLD